MPTTLNMPTQEQWQRAEAELQSSSSTAPTGLCTISPTLRLPMQATSDLGKIDAHFEFFQISTLFGESKLVVVPSVGSELGSGTFATVVKAIDKEGVEYALKIGFKAVDFFDVHERSILTELDELEASGYLDGNKPLLLMKLKEGHKLTSLLSIVNNDPTLQFLIAIKILQVLEILAKKRIVHGDIKPDNIVVGLDKDGNFTVDIIDFGMAYKLGEEDIQDRKILHQIGTPSYMSPEGLRGEVSITSDLFSFACMLQRDFKLTLDGLNPCLAREYGCRPSVAATLASFLAMERNLQAAILELDAERQAENIIRILQRPEYQDLQSILLNHLLRRKNVTEHDLMLIAQTLGLLNQLIEITIQQENYRFLDILLNAAQDTGLELTGLTYERVATLYFAAGTSANSLSVRAACYYIYAYFTMVVAGFPPSKLVDRAATAMIDIGKYSFSETQVQTDLQPFVNHFSEIDDALPLLGILFNRAINLSITYIIMGKFYENMLVNAKFRHSLFEALFYKDYWFIGELEARVLLKLLPSFANVRILKEWIGTDVIKEQKVLTYLVNHIIQISKLRTFDIDTIKVLFGLVQGINADNQYMQRNFAASGLSNESTLPAVNIEGLLEIITTINPDLGTSLALEIYPTSMARAAAVLR